MPQVYRPLFESFRSSSLAISLPACFITQTCHGGGMRILDSQNLLIRQVPTPVSRRAVAHGPRYCLAARRLRFEVDTRKNQSAAENTRGAGKQILIANQVDRHIGLIQPAADMAAPVAEPLPDLRIGSVQRVAAAIH